MNLQASVTGRAEFLNLSAADAALLNHHAALAKELLDQLAPARASGDYMKVRAVAAKAMSFYSLKVCAVARRGLGGLKEPTLNDILVRARQLNAFQPTKEVVVVKLKPKDNGTYRPVLDFGWKRRSLIDMAVCVLDTALPRFPFDFLELGAGGKDAATLHLKEGLEAKGHEYMLTADIENCYRSATKEKVVNLLPFPPRVTRNVILVGKQVQVKVKLPKDMASDSSQGIAAISEADEAARQGLPQGSPASSLIMRRAVLGPALVQQSFSDDLALYEDDLAVSLKTQAEADATLDTLKSICSTSPAGPLPIRYAVGHISQGFTYLGYHVGPKRNDPTKMHVRPSLRAFDRAEGKALQRCKAKGLKAAYVYFRRWRRSFRLWKPTWGAKVNQLLSLASCALGVGRILAPARCRRGG